MGESIRITAKTVEDAIIEACMQLGVSRENIEYSIIEKGTAGFFGIGGKKAVIEAKKKYTDEELKNEVFGTKVKKELKTEEKLKTEEIIKKDEKPEVKPEIKSDNKELKKEIKKDSKKEIKKEVKTLKTDKTKKEEVKKEEVKKENLKKEFSKKDVQKKDNQKREIHKNEVLKNEIMDSVSTLKEDCQEPSVTKIAKIPADPEEATRRAETFLKDVFHTMDMEVVLKSTFEDDVLSVDLEGNNMGLLIGKRGQTLDSLQYLTSLVVNKGKNSYVRVKLDTEDYRNRRKATLENLAKNIAYKVKKTRRPVFLEPMNPYERRIIHSALQNDPYVTTHSEGDEPCRKVVVTLKKKEKQHQ